MVGVIYEFTNINFHRPCFFSETIMDKKGKEKKRYPYEKNDDALRKTQITQRSRNLFETYLKDGMTFKQLDEFALEMSDNEAARQLSRAKDLLFKRINEQEAA